ncbi:MAG: ABC transporter substrate-binding protein [Candidatus Nitronauta litoralis]|uniref:ABC transporter substrate-binding protein n=1 Tax=Candidatus Nitronauta litoralis TaxID=2705533 RepID=A0A7T0BZ66_9BACT|nr:MAG: ABC transporter substrate-binding protein [Candidatus Nitronauta litoralis]
MKVVSLLPSATDIVCRLGLEDKLVGRSHSCDFPPSVLDLPALTSTRVEPYLPSVEIHRSVENILKEAVTVYQLDEKKLQELAPDFIITQNLCDVCAVSYGQVENACKQAFGDQAQLISLQPGTLEDVWQTVKQVAEALDAVSAYESFRNDVEKRTKYIQEKVANLSKKRVLTIEWIDPVYIGGLWMADMVEICGGKPLFSKPGEKAVVLNAEQLQSIDPEVVVVKPCGFNLDQLIGEIDRLKQQVPWQNWTASREQQFYFVDGNRYFNRPGPFLMESLEILAYCTHPEAFPDFGTRYARDCIRLSAGLELPVN